jgi:hypothetical protein
LQYQRQRAAATTLVPEIEMLNLVLFLDAEMKDRKKKKE